MKSIEAVQRGQATSINNMESQFELLTLMIAKRLLSSLPSNTEQIPKEQAEAITLWSVKDLEMTSPIYVDEEEKTTQVPEESTSLRLQEPLQATSVVGRKWERWAINLK